MYIYLLTSLTYEFVSIIYCCCELFINTYIKKKKQNENFSDKKNSHFTPNLYRVLAISVENFDDMTKLMNGNIFYDL